MRSRLGKWLYVGGAWTATTLALGVAGSGCLAREVGQQPPTTKVNFTSTVSQQAVDKVDILFAIDNSASMGDKQSILADAVPDLINGLLRPRCVDGDGKPEPGGAVASPTGTKEDHFGCPSTGGVQYDPEFKPVTDMHIGIVSSSLGNFGGDICPVATRPRNDDRGHLINIKPAGGEVELASPHGYLAWFPTASQDNQDPSRHPVPDKPIETIEGPGGLTENFKDMVVGVGQDGCGFEAQLESVYRFLVQPDPWDAVTLNGANQADLGDKVDRTVLKQRADFLRPDSLVAVIMLTDEDDSSADPLAIGGQGWAFMNKQFPGSKVFRAAQGNGTTAPRGTTACETDPGSDACTSCGFQTLCNAGDPACDKLKADPNCKSSGLAGQSGDGYDGYYGPTDDELNVRFHRMKERYGIDPQYPLKRYIDGFTKFRVPDRTTEHVTKPVAGSDPARNDIAEYSSTPKCTNPLFAAKLPTGVDDDELCNLQQSTRSPDQIFFAVVGGVPHQLLHFDPNDADKSRITNEDWVKILGKDPANYDYTGIDPHMIQSVAPRAGLSGASDPKGSNGTDKIHGREWNTGKADLQYACTFDLPPEKVRTCTDDDQSCDCAPSSATNPPLCDSGNKQIKAKAYPTIREFQVVRALGDQGIISSLCPITLDDAKRNDPSDKTYGYRPAVSVIIDRLKNALTTQCLPRKLRDPGAPVEAVPCLVLAQLSEDGDSCDKHGLKEPEKAILDVFRQQQKAESGNAGPDGLDFSKLPVCVIEQANPVVQPGETCKSDNNPSWCYVENANGQKPAGQRCSQAVILSSGTAGLVGARFSLQCIQQFGAGEAAGDVKPNQ